MTGPEHYAEAERLVALASKLEGQSTRTDIRLLVDVAKVHAQLADVAMAAEQEYGTLSPDRRTATADAWLAVVS